MSVLCGMIKSSLMYFLFLTFYGYKILLILITIIDIARTYSQAFFPRIVINCKAVIY